MGESVKLVGITVPVLEELGPTATAQDLLIYIARVSNPSNQLNLDTGDKLLRYLYRKRHWSPFEMVSLTMEFNTTRDIGRQILRHRSFSFQEFSQRYADPTKELGFELREARLQDNQNRQNSLETDDEQLQLEWQEEH
jgi:thymidylate synthase (FAD)